MSKKDNYLPDGWPRETFTMLYYMLAGVLAAEGGKSDDLECLQDIISQYNNVEFFDVDTLEVVYFAFVRNYKVIKETLSLSAYNEFNTLYKAISGQYFKLKTLNHE